MNNTIRRDLLRLGSASLAFPLVAALDTDCMANKDESIKHKTGAGTGNGMKVQYLEIVTPEVDAVCKTHEQLQGVTFGRPDANLGNARTAKLPNGGLLGVRAPLRATEKPIVRPYFLVKDIEDAVSKAAASGAKIALPPMQLPGHGTCAIFIQGGTEHGLWQL